MSVYSTTAAGNERKKSDCNTFFCCGLRFLLAHALAGAVSLTVAMFLRIAVRRTVTGSGVLVTGVGLAL